jgi:hypothetical protein
MSLSIETLARHYAVISVCSKPHQELVVAYPDEKSLRGLFAAPSIVALGYRSRAEAVAYIDGIFQTGCIFPHESKTSLRRVHQRITDCGIQRTSAAKADRPSARRKIRHLFHYGAAVAIGLIYSQNVVSAMLRAFVSF